MVTLSYRTNYSYRSGYYIVDGQNITLNCTFDVTRQTVRWSAGGLPVYAYNYGTLTIASSSYKSRLTDYKYTEREHYLVLIVNKSEDEGLRFKCAVPLDLVTDENDDIQIAEILGELDILQHIILHCFPNFQCCGLFCIVYLPEKTLSQ